MSSLLPIIEPSIARSRIMRQASPGQLGNGQLGNTALGNNSLCNRLHVDWRIADRRVARASVWPLNVSRCGFTLLELMLVLAIITAIAAIAAPMLGRAFERQKLRAAIETLKLQWEEARLTAMKTGQAQVFTCELSSDSYSIKPLILQSDLINAGTGATIATMGGLVETANTGRGTVAVASDGASSFEKQLEESTFLSCVAVSDLRAYMVASTAQASMSGDLTTQTVASSVVFYPDGSTSTAEVRIQSKSGDIRILQIRGLTGHCRVIEMNVATDAESKA